MEDLQILSADVHIHTCLSPCASLDMTPVKIVHEAARKNLAIIAIADHNSAANTAAVMKAAEKTGLLVIPGIEVTTSEEVHLIGLFEEVRALEKDYLSRQEKLAILELEMKIRELEDRRQQAEVQINAHEAEIERQEEKIGEMKRKSLFRRLLRR